MVKSKTKSVTSAEMTAGLVLIMLLATQVSCTGARIPRIYGQVRLETPNQLCIGYSPA
jgi:hypothetical protein